jgi:hypothetical protein
MNTALNALIFLYLHKYLSPSPPITFLSTTTISGELISVNIKLKRMSNKATNIIQFIFGSESSIIKIPGFKEKKIIQE